MKQEENYRCGNMWYDPLTQHEHDMKLVSLSFMLMGLGQNGLTC